MAKKVEPFKLPSLRQIARNALKAHREGWLQATNDENADSCKYYKGRKGKHAFKCVIGASLPDDLAKKFDKRGQAFVGSLLASDLLIFNGNDCDLIDLQRNHDRATTFKTDIPNFLDDLKRLAGR